MQLNVFADIPMVGEYACWAGGIYPSWVYDPDSFCCNAKDYVDEGKVSTKCYLDSNPFSSVDWMYAVLLIFNWFNVRLYGSVVPKLNQLSWFFIISIVDYPLGCSLIIKQENLEPYFDFLLWLFYLSLCVQIYNHMKGFKSISFHCLIATS